jgi:hypothetical protein
VRHQPHRVLRALEPRLHPAEYFADVSRGAPEQPALEDGARFLNMLMKPCEVKTYSPSVKLLRLSEQLSGPDCGIADIVVCPMRETVPNSAAGLPRVRRAKPLNSRQFLFARVNLASAQPR